MEKLIHDTLVGNYVKYYRLAYSYVHNESDAQDIVQEGAYKAILNSGKLQNRAFADTWICRIMINEALQFLRTRKREAGPLEEYQETGKEDCYGDEDLKTALDSLQENDRTVIVLRFFEDRTLEEIARILEENVSTVKSRLYRTLKRLQLTLSEGGYGV